MSEERGKRWARGPARRFSEANCFGNWAGPNFLPFPTTFFRQESLRKQRKRIVRKQSWVGKRIVRKGKRKLGRKERKEENVGRERESGEEKEKVGKRKRKFGFWVKNLWFNGLTL